MSREKEEFILKEEEIERQMEREREVKKALEINEGEEATDEHHPFNCEICEKPFFLYSECLDADVRDSFGCGWKVVRLNGKYVCPFCLVDNLWEKGKRELNIGEESVCQ